jgi:hypothetical protein
MRDIFLSFYDIVVFLLKTEIVAGDLGEAIGTKNLLWLIRLMDKFGDLVLYVFCGEIISV